MAALLNDRDIALQAATYRSTDTLVTVSASAGAFKTPKNGAVTTPANIVLTATPNNVFTVAAVYTWHYALSTAPNTWVALTTSTTATITNANILAVIGEATWVQYRCTVTENLLTSASGFFTVSYSKEVSEPIVVDISRTNAIIPCNAAGVPTGYTNTDTSISVTRGGVALTYNAAGGANTFKVSIQTDDAARTVGTSSNTSTVYSLSGITNIMVDIATVVFVVTVYDASGTIVSPTIGKQITYTKVTNGVVGGDATYYYIDTSAPVISKSVSSALISGTHTNITATGKKVVGSALPTLAGFLTITANGDVEATTAVNSITTAINNTAGKTSYTVKMYNQATVAGATLLDTEVIPVLFTGSDTIAAVLTNDAASIPTNSAGTSGIYTSTPTEIHVYEGVTELTYDGVGTAAGTWKIATTSATNITIGTITDSGLFATIGTASNIIADTASITFNISGTSKGGNAFTATKLQTFSKAYAGAQGTAGDPGISGPKSITIFAYKWGTSIGTFAQAATYTWSGNTISAFPVGWTAAAPASTANGQTLYQLNLIITDISTATTTAVNWSSAVSNTIGYRIDGTVGTQGNSHRTAYVVNTSATPPASPTPLTGDQAPTGWSFTATSTLTAGQFMYQVDGILTAGANIAWGNPYLSNLKVGSLSAISADMGTVAISSVGSLASSGKGYGTGTGFYLGYSSGYKFDIGSPTNYLRWDGTNIVSTGMVIKNSVGVTVLASGSAVAEDIMNSAIKVGGRNLLPDSQNAVDLPNNTGLGTSVKYTNETIPYWKITASAGNVSTYNNHVYNLPLMQVGKTYTISCDVRIAAAGDVSFYSGGTPTACAANTWTRMSWTFVFTSQLMRFSGHTYAGNIVDYRNYKVEEGNVATDWTPAPEDVVAGISDAATKANWTGLSGAVPTTVANSAISISATGLLSGAGGGQIVTLPVRDVPSERTLDRPPNWYPVGTTKEFKQAASIGLVSGDLYCTLETIIQYQDASGGSVYQYAYRGLTTWRRYGIAGAASWAGAWVQDLDRNTYTGDLNATNDLLLISTGNAVVVGNTIQVSNSGTWGNASAYTKLGYTGGAAVSGSFSGGNEQMFGLNTDPLTNNSYDTIDLVFYWVGNNTVYAGWANWGAQIVVATDATPSDVWSLTYDGVKNRWFRNGIEVHSQAASPNILYYFDSALSGTGSVSGIKFGPLSSNDWSAAGGVGKPADNATVGATWGSNLSGQPADAALLNSANSSGTNLCYNGDFANGLDGWIVQNNPFGALVNYCNSLHSAGAGNDWAPNRGVGLGATAFHVQQPNTTASGYFEIIGPLVPVQGGKRYITSIYTGAHRCKVDVFIYTYDINGSPIVPIGNDLDFNDENYSGGVLLSAYKRHQVVSDLGASVSSIRIVVRKFWTKNGGDSWLFAARAQVEEVGSTATLAGGWASPGTGINSLTPITSTNISTYMASAAIGDAQIGALDAGKINTGFLNAGRIQVSSLSGDKITVNTLAADRLVANSITATQLAATNLITASAQIGNGIVDTLQVAGEAIIANRFASGDDTALWGGYNTVILTATSVNPGTGSVVIIATCAGSSDSGDAMFQLARNGTLIGSVFRANANLPGSYSFKDSPGAGNHVYTLRNVGSYALANYGPRTLLVIGCKR